MLSHFIKTWLWLALLFCISACAPRGIATPTAIESLAVLPSTAHTAVLPTPTATAAASESPSTATRAIPSATFTLEAIPTATETRAALVLTTATSEPTFAPSATFVPPSPTAMSVPTRIPPTPFSENVTRGIATFAEMKCASCHVKPARGQRIAPDLDHIATEAEQIIRLPDYHGSARDVPSFLLESIVDPNAYVQPPFGNLTVDGSSLMPKDFGQKLNAQQLQDLVAYLLTRR